MNKILIILFLIFSFQNLDSQTRFNKKRNKTFKKIQFEIGANVSYKFSVNGVNPIIGTQTDFSFIKIPDISITSFIPISRKNNLATILNFGIESYNYSLKDIKNFEKYSHNFTYINFSPNIYIEGFLIGFNFGIPVSAAWNSEDINLDNINTMTEFKVGGVYEITRTRKGRFMANFMLSFMLNDIFVNYKKDDPLLNIIKNDYDYIRTNSSSPRTISISFGFTYYLYIF
jgi:hypothetical protein